MLLGCVSSLRKGPAFRITSIRPSDSIRTTVAPWSARFRVAIGAAIAHVKSKTLIPSNGLRVGAGSANTGATGVRSRSASTSSVFCPNLGGASRSRRGTLAFAKRPGNLCPTAGTCSKNSRASRCSDSTISFVVATGAMRSLRS